MRNKTLSLTAVLGLAFVSFFLFLTAQIAFAVPGISSAQYLDTDGDRNVDTIRIDFDQEVIACDLIPSDFIIIEDGEYSLTIGEGAIDCAFGSSVISIPVINGGPAVSTAGDNPQITIAFTDVDDGFIQFADETFFPASDIIVNDGIQPYVTSIDITQVQYEGHLRNALEVQYSEIMAFYPNADGVAATHDVITETTAAFGSFDGAFGVSGLIDWEGEIIFGRKYTSNDPAIAVSGNRFRVEEGGKQITIAFAIDPLMYSTGGGSVVPGVNINGVVNVDLVTDVSGNTLELLSDVRTTKSEDWDVVAPRVTFSQSCDMDRNGALDYVEVQTDEPIVEGSFVAGIDSSWFGLTADDDGTIDIGEAAYSTAYTDCGRLADPMEIAGDDSFGVALNGEIENTRSLQLVIEDDDIGFFRDGAGNRIAPSFNAGFRLDGANPVITDLEPAAGLLSDYWHDRETLNAEVYFSETVDIDSEIAVRVENVNTGEELGFELDTDTDQLYIDIDVSGLDVEICDSIRVTLNPDAIEDRGSGSLPLVGTSNFSLTWTYDYCPAPTVGGGSSFISTPPSFDINFLAPAVETILEVGEIVQLLWEDLSNVSVDYVNLWFQEGEGEWQEIVSADLNDGSYQWTVPEHEEVLSVKIELTDLATVIAEDTLGPFTREELDGDIGDPMTPGVGGLLLDDDLEVTAPGSGIFGLSPLTGEEQEISIVEPGDYITSQSTFTVYYIDEEMKRHPLIDTQTFFTWNNSFDVVKVVTDATLPTLPMSTPMLPKPGTVLVKIHSVNDVYALLDSDNVFKPELRALIDEDQAQRLYGEDWADYVIDLPPTLWKHFRISDEGMHVDLIDDGLLKREDINPTE
ncbi:MAG: hypothetical protein O3B64_00490 [bacterium]|nr:hypothetical protein [bacterium]